MNYLRKYRQAEKIIDCNKINEICDKHFHNTNPEEKAVNIYNDICDALIYKPAIDLLYGLKEEIVEKTKNGMYEEADNIGNDIWLKFRHLGIGGSDAASIMGTSKFRSCYDLYLDKTNQTKPEKIPLQKQYIFDFGHCIEPFVAKAFKRRFNKEYRSNFELLLSLNLKETVYIEDCRVFRDTYMYRNPEHPEMLADVDFVVEFDLDNGKTIRGIFECKTTSPYTISDDWSDEPPVYYQTQIQHYMNVLDYDFSVIACCSDNNYSNFFAHLIFRDDDYSKKLIAKEEKFWKNVQNQIPPFEEGVNNLASLSEQTDKNNKAVLKIKDAKLKEKIEKYNSLTLQQESYNMLASSIKKEKDTLASDVLTVLVQQGYSLAETEDFDIITKERNNNRIAYSDMFRAFKKKHPELLKEIQELEADYKNTAVSYSCNIKQKKK